MNPDGRMSPDRDPDRERAASRLSQFTRVSRTINREHIIASGIVLLALVLLVTPYAIRYVQGNRAMINSETYTLLEPYVEGTDMTPTNVSVLMIAGIPAILTSEALRAVAILCGMLTIIFFYMLLRSANISERTIQYAAIVLAISPLYLRTFIDYTPIVVIIPLTLLAVYMIHVRKPVIAGVIIAILPWANAVIGTIIVALCIAYMLFMNRMNVWMTIISILSVVAALFLSFGSSIVLIAPADVFLAEIGSPNGFSFAFLTLSIIGLALLFERGWQHMFLYLTIVVVVGVSFFMPFLRMYILLLFSVYAGFAITHITRRKWSIPIIKKITLLLIGCSILFSSLVYITGLANMHPTTYDIQASSAIKRQALEGDRVLAYAEYAYFLQYYTGLEPVLHPQSAQRLLTAAEYESLFTSRKLDRTEQILKKSAIRFVYVDKKLREELEEKQGLLFVMKNTDKFTLLYQNAKVEVWMYTG